MAAPAAADCPALTYPERSAPLAAIAAAAQAGLPLTVTSDPKLAADKPAVLALPSGEELLGQDMILRYAARAGPSGQELYGSDALTATQVDQWIGFSSSLVSGAGLEPTVAVLNTYLSMRTYLVGYSLTLADIACWGQLQATLQWDKLKKSYPHAARWYDFCGEVPTLAHAAEQHGRRRRTLADVVKENKAAGKGGGDTGSWDIKLPDAAEGKVVTRFPPEPSGYLHIGHAKAALMNQYFAELYKGTLLVRFDDTNPSKEKDEFVENILADIATLGLKFKRLSYTSDYFPQLMDLGERMIKAGLIYADDTPVLQMREERMVGTESKHRNRPPAETLAVFEEMKAGTEVGQAHALRLKMDMRDPNKAMRDPVAFRCNLTHHWRTGHTYKVYPTYDMACPFVDALEGVTHALRTSEYKDREAQYYWILKAQQGVWPGLPHVHLWDFSRLSFVNTVLSKRKLLWFVETGRVEGWTDPRMPTVQGIFRRGLQLAALKEFILSQGASKNVTFQEWDKLWTINKRLIDPVAPRHTAVSADGRVPLHIAGAPQQPEVDIVLRHKKNPAVGKKAVTRQQDIWLDQADAAAVAEGEEVTLMDWGNCIIRGITIDEAGVVTALQGELHLEGSVKATKLKLTWLPVSEELVPLTCVDLGHLITKKKLEEGDVFEDFVAPLTRWETEALGDANMRTLQKGDIIQLERKGYFIVDQPLIRASKPMVLFSIPDGRAAKPGAPGGGEVPGRTSIANGTS